MEKKIRILGIAPYEGMKSTMLKLAKERNDMDLTVYVGDLQKGAEIAQKNLHENYDIIISRGGTAELIGRMTQVPVIEISLSVYDVLRAIKLAENFYSHYAIVGFPGITTTAQLLCDLLQYQVEIVTIHKEEEVQNVLESLQKKGCRMVLCDMIANTTAKRLGLNAILITSGNESIGNAFNQAVKLFKTHSRLREENTFFHSVIRNTGQETVVLTETGELFFSTIEQSDHSPILDLLKKELPTAFTEDRRFFKTIDGMLYAVTSLRIPFYEENYVVFYLVSNKIPFIPAKYGIQYWNKKDVETHFFNSFYSLTRSVNELQTTIDQMMQTDFPIMIIGEEGTGKEQLARMIYTKSPLQNHPFIFIDFTLMNDKSWNFLIDHYNSPFNDNNITIYLKNIDVLSEDRQKQLLSSILDMNLCHRNRLLLSCICDINGSVPQTCMNFINLLSCLTIPLPPLRKRPEDIPTLANLYLSTLNINLAKEILGLESGAMDLLMKYDWPYNYTQFKKILGELIVITTTSYIKESSVMEILKKERSMFPLHQNNADLSSFHLNRTLNEINQDIIRSVLAETKGNQTAAAKRLGISRTTLWRLLK